MERQRSFSNHSISSADSWELVKTNAVGAINEEKEMKEENPIVGEEGIFITNSSVAIDDKLDVPYTSPTLLSMKQEITAEDSTSSLDSLLDNIMINSAENANIGWPSQEEDTNSSVSEEEEIIQDQRRDEIIVQNQQEEQIAIQSQPKEEEKIAVQDQQEEVVAVKSQPEDHEVVIVQNQQEEVITVQKHQQPLQPVAIMHASESELLFLGSTGAISRPEQHNPIAILVAVMSIICALTLFESTIWAGYNLAQNETTAKNDQEEHINGNVCPKNICELYEICEGELAEYKTVFESNMNSIKQLRSQKLRQAKTIRELQSELNRLKPSEGQRDKILLPPSLMPPPPLSLSVKEGQQEEECLSADEKLTMDWQQGQRSSNSWITQRAEARKEHRVRRMRDNYSSPNFNPNFAQWLFARASLRHKLRKQRRDALSNVRRFNNDDDVWAWFDRRYKMRGKLRGNQQQRQHRRSEEIDKTGKNNRWDEESDHHWRQNEEFGKKWRDKGRGACGDAYHHHWPNHLHLSDWDSDIDHDNYWLFD